jgi:lysine-N-methylase
MRFRVPFYYNDFHCITDKCNDNCCVGGWEIGIDKETYDKYMNLEGELGEAIRNSITKNEDGDYCFKLNNGQCPHLLDSGLCRLHSELGEDHLGVVCSQFPRYTDYFGNNAECKIMKRIIHDYRIINTYENGLSILQSNGKSKYYDLSEVEVFKIETLK